MEKDQSDSSYFPLLLEYTETKEIVVVQKPKDIISGKSFIVHETNYRGENKFVKHTEGM